MLSNSEHQVSLDTGQAAVLSIFAEILAQRDLAFCRTRARSRAHCCDFSSWKGLLLRKIISM